MDFIFLLFGFLLYVFYVLYLFLFFLAGSTGGGRCSLDLPAKSYTACIKNQVWGALGCRDVAISGFLLSLAPSALSGAGFGGDSSAD